MKSKWIWGVATAALLALIWFGFAGRPEAQMRANAGTAAGTNNPGQPAPAFELKDLKGNTVSLAELKGQKVYVKFWASWCPICLAGLDELNQLSGQDNGYKVLTIVSPGYNGEQSAADFAAWFSKRGYDNIEVLLDDGGTWAKKFGVRGYPTSVYIGSDGILAQTVPGHNANEAITANFQSIH
ncbi:redoxin domain-containing protein [Paenibacillus doosanensis]|nr:MULTISPECIES: redoxin domain-containing protein [Paenibacillus]MCS7460470.1 redoxin domain-containing protein [Paenibacillus doosanensis]